MARLACDRGASPNVVHDFGYAKCFGVRLSDHLGRATADTLERYGRVGECAMAERTLSPLVTAFACAAVSFVIGISVVFGFLAPQLAGSAHASGRVLGVVAATVAIPALLAGFLARRSATPWSIARIVVVYVAALILVVAAQVVSQATNLAPTRTKDLKAKNASKDMMLSVDDYLLMLPQTELMERVREATRAKDAVNLFQESWPTPTGDYRLLYLHRSKGAIVSCHLIVSPNGTEATKAADELFRGTMAGMTDKLDITLSIVSGLEAWQPEGRFYFVTEKTGLPFANIFLLRKDNNVVLVVSRGPYVYNDPGSIKDFLSSKIDGLLSFKPMF
jgi:hypothetical protein